MVSLIFLRTDYVSNGFRSNIFDADPDSPEELLLRARSALTTVVGDGEENETIKYPTGDLGSLLERAAGKRSEAIQRLMIESVSMGRANNKIGSIDGTVIGLKGSKGPMSADMDNDAIENSLPESAFTNQEKGISDKPLTMWAAAFLEGELSDLQDLINGVLSVFLCI